VAEHLAEHLGRRDGKFLGQADRAAIEMDSSQRPAKLPTPLDLHGPGEVREAPPAPPVFEEGGDAYLDDSAARRRHVRDASTS